MVNGIQKELVLKEKGVLHLSGFTASQIEGFLAEKHKKDVFIAQCKNGETRGVRDLLKLDGWALLRTYSPLTTIGYEIKVSRQDFENDQKWTGYLDLCHLFYFVCPAGLIRATDLPQNIGIIWVSRNGNLHTKRRAERHEPDIQKQHRLLIYALMSRSKIVSDMYEANKQVEPMSKLETYRKWLKEAEEKQELAWMVGGHVKKVVASVEQREHDVADKELAVKDFEERLAKLGITWDLTVKGWNRDWKVRDEINLLDQRIDESILNKMRAVAHAFTSLEQDINNYRNKSSQLKESFKGE